LAWLAVLISNSARTMHALASFRATCSWHRHPSPKFLHAAARSMEALMITFMLSHRLHKQGLVLLGLPQGRHGPGSFNDPQISTHILNAAGGMGGRVCAVCRRRFPFGDGDKRAKMKCLVCGRAHPVARLFEPTPPHDAHDDHVCMTVCGGLSGLGNCF
jgi:hypothetical protein